MGTWRGGVGGLSATPPSRCPLSLAFHRLWGLCVEGGHHSPMSLGERHVPEGVTCPQRSSSHPGGAFLSPSPLLGGSGGLMCGPPRGGRGANCPSPEPGGVGGGDPGTSKGAAGAQVTMTPMGWRGRQSGKARKRCHLPANCPCHLTSLPRWHHVLLSVPVLTPRPLLSPQVPDEFDGGE